MDVTAPLTVLRLAHVTPRMTSGWLVQDLWASQAVGCIGGNPKEGKTWIALDLAVSVASGTPCLGRFPVRERGPVLYFAAEDSPEDIRDRGCALADAHKVPFDSLLVGLIQEPVLRLDSAEDRRRLVVTLDAKKPRLLILDPFVRLHCADENSASQVTEILSFLRILQRQFAIAIVLVHHVRKSGASQPGQSLRGSGDIHAWGDSNLYLVRQGEDRILHVEHRAHPAINPLRLNFVSSPPHFEVAGPVDSSSTPVEKSIIELLGRSPMTRAALRETLRIRNETLCAAVQGLIHAGRITQNGDSLALPVPASGAGTGARA